MAIFFFLLLLLNQIQDNDSTLSKSKTNVGGKMLMSHLCKKGRAEVICSFFCGIWKAGKSPSVSLGCRTAWQSWGSLNNRLQPSAHRVPCGLERFSFLWKSIGISPALWTAQTHPSSCASLPSCDQNWGAPAGGLCCRWAEGCAESRQSWVFTQCYTLFGF